MEKRRQHSVLNALFSLSVAGLLIHAVSCSGPGTRPPAGVQVDSAFMELFAPDSGGITGADGIFSIPLPDGSSVFLTGDCFLGVVRSGARDMSTRMLNNSMIRVSPDRTSAQAIYTGTWEDPWSLFVPPPEEGVHNWYWPGHGFYRDSILYVFALNMYTDSSLFVISDKDPSEKDRADEMTEAAWSFAVAGIDLLRYSYPDFEFLGSDRIENTYYSEIHFGNNVLEDGNYIYFFGTRNDPGAARVYAARTGRHDKPYHLGWEFYNGKEWVDDYREAAPLDIDIPVSEQFTIFRMKDKYVLLTHEKSSFDIYTYTSDYPYKGFTNKTFIYSSPEPDSTNNLFAYNALAHPQYMDGDMLLVSYCINSRDVRDVFEDADNYRARFIRVPLGMIDPSFQGYQPGFRLAMAQMAVEGGNREANLARAVGMIAEAAGNSADIILLPELMDLGWAHPSVLTEATPIPGGETSRMLTGAARQNNVWVCAGLAEKDGDRTYNAALLISSDGEILIHHRKINILDIARDFYGQGRGLRVVETPFGNIGVMICADGFADQRVITQTLCYMGADIILSPTSWALPPEKKDDRNLATDIWYGHYAPVAAKYSVYIAGCSNVGRITAGPWEGYSAIGNSLLIGPEGNILAGNRFGEDAETIVYCDVVTRSRPVRGTDWTGYFGTR
jgi:predicted amidohydrolase